MMEESPFSALDRQFGDFVERLHGSPAPALRTAAMLVSRRRAEGHICVPVEELPTPLGASRVIGAPNEFAPLVLDGPRLYLRRYWQYEQQLARAIRQRVAGQWPKRKTKITDLQQLGATNAV